MTQSFVYRCPRRCEITVYGKDWKVDVVFGLDFLANHAKYYSILLINIYVSVYVAGFVYT